ncbi:DUF3073 domain-containing protein [Actinocrinis puniceicyclus]|uniref:DUF3073 domain-containing protein n=1 Tax=Actinocrinis puniceicyclus TaxID=977794 RepID=A0A8J7WSD9_9ACTN|nr:DUF3073 domain-containing protein [Actinocrinis puniceicyclus]MBS2965132.1 DUF3073 domain-containing protein [Actinocrinis puniceicyclus]
MGRGRAKAKQTRVARQLKYSGGATDLDRLRSELGVGDSRRNGAEDHHLDERYAAWAEQDEEDDEDEEEEDEEDISPYRPHQSNGSSRHRAS